MSSVVSFGGKHEFNLKTQLVICDVFDKFVLKRFVQFLHRFVFTDI